MALLIILSPRESLVNTLLKNSELSILNEGGLENLNGCSKFLVWYLLSLDLN
jgi:hypothetical protein